MKKRWFVGLKDGRREIFSADYIPTHDTDGERYSAVIGPFRTKRGTLYMCRYGRSNPHCQTVYDAERLGKLYPDLCR